MGILEVDRYGDPESTLWKQAPGKTISQIERARADGSGQSAFQGAETLQIFKICLLRAVVEGSEMGCMFVFFLTGDDCNTGGPHEQGPLELNRHVA